MARGVSQRTQATRPRWQPGLAPQRAELGPGQRRGPEPGPPGKGPSSRKAKKAKLGHHKEEAKISETNEAAALGALRHAILVHQPPAPRRPPRGPGLAFTGPSPGQARHRPGAPWPRPKTNGTRFRCAAPAQAFPRSESALGRPALPLPEAALRPASTDLANADSDERTARCARSKGRGGEG